MSVWADAIAYGTHADRPAAGLPGRVYCESDTGNTYRDSGTAWALIASLSTAPPWTFTVVAAAADHTIASGNTFLVLSGIHVVTLPDPVAAVGQSVIVRSATADSFSMQNPDTSAADGTGQCPWHGVSDGTQWWNVDF